ncbi:uncharacterized protein TRIADDRAFT_51538 [Trichoplax adhaerens]|uniref:Dynein axonemal assembly factor 5 TPR repeats domain-containing protein n=1 Tax=Trichoplax adhaerens TaxID=10228 RepID=B3RJP4_TRIAD|nr:hypothetical protein TRIADDRAFT_51538 [Trichoplax adhaerens]EDV28534.1 hypothetical protein TRIADDRAFT_51538 [Trichoplax adhaerens]|eukprot:XP_002107736.1 hypothetical protein TRIADDRAFT_51538 [Trichoplax adhaerens]
MDPNRDQWCTLLSSHNKLDRDKGLSQLTDQINLGLNDITHVENSLITLIQATDRWESCQGGLLASKLLLLHIPQCSQDFIGHLQDSCTHLLQHSEARVRFAAGEVAGALCKRLGHVAYQHFQHGVLQSIRDNMERSMELLDALAMQQLKDKMLPKSPDKDTKNEPQSKDDNLISKILHDTAGWQSLETGMQCLECMIDGCGKKFHPYINNELLELLFETTKHTNRCVREIGFRTLGVLIKSELGSNEKGTLQPGYKETKCWEKGTQFVDVLVAGLSDNWSQVRLAASIATRQMLTILTDVDASKRYFPSILPPMCLNRYYIAEGVRNYSQENWRLTVGPDGRNLVESYVADFVKFYVQQTNADNHAVREAACVCIAELGQKISPECLHPFVQQLIATLLVCFKDQSWPVRDAACLACGNFISCFPEPCRPSLSELHDLFVKNLSDSIQSVRQGAAISLAKVAEVYGNDEYIVIEKTIIQGLAKMKDQPADAKRYSSMDPSPAVYSVAKRIRDNEADLHTNRMTYSCGSLAPKLGKGDTENEMSKFYKQPEPWELADGCVHLIAELSRVSTFHTNISKLLPAIAEAGRYKQYSQHVFFYETICKQSSECSLTSHAARECLQFFSKNFGPKILRGRVEEFNPNYVSLLDSVIRVA